MKLLLVDGYSLLYRAFYSSPPLTTKDGQPTGALYGFMRMLARLLDDAKPDCALVALDAHGPTFRHDSFEAYKANRSAAPDDLSAQTARVRDLLKGLSIPYYDHAGFEADDILGTLASMSAERGDEVTIVTGDGDALQLVNERVSVMLTRKGVSELDCYTPADVRERYGFDPLLVPDYKGLRGDSSDNIPGIPGIGEKTAIKLVCEYGGMEGIYENLEEVKPPRIRELLRTHRDIAFQSRDLARIVTDLPIDISLQDCDLPALHLDDERRAKALQTVREYEFKSLIPRYAGTGEAGEPVSTTAAAVEAEEKEWITLHYQTERASSADEAKAWLASTSSAGVAVILAPGYLALAQKDRVLLYDGQPADLREWLEDASVRKIVHDAKTAKLDFLAQGVSLRGVVADTTLMSYLLEPNKQHHELTTIAKKHLLCILQEISPKPVKGKKARTESLFGDESTSEDEAEKAEKQRLETALAESACAASLLEPILRKELQSIGCEKLFDELELPLVDVLVGMERCGMTLDIDRLREVGRELENEAARLQKEIWELAGEEFNIGSPKQLQVILFEKLGLAKGRSTKSGYSTDASTLDKLAEEHEVVRKILEYRGTTKLKSTYTDTLLAGMNPQTHRIHTSLNQTGTVSGRVSSSNPNLQNIPIRTEQGRQIRRCFIAPKGQVFLKADYSQIELRILAHITHDPPLIEAFQSGEDVHARTAADLFDVDVKDVDDEMRRKAKMTNYAIAYGVSGFGLAQQLGNSTPGEAQAIIKRYFEALPGVKKYMEDTLEEARKAGFVQTLLGRRRPLPEILSPRGPERAGAERTAINHPIQGSAADIMKIAMLAVHEAMREKQVRACMIMQIHDELVFEVPPDEVKVLAPLVRDLMAEVPTRELKLDVPLEVDVSVGENWNDAAPVDFSAL